MGRRLAEGTRLEWLDARVESGFSHCLFVDRAYSADPVMRRISSLARKFGSRSVLIESLEDSKCPLRAEPTPTLAEDAAADLGINGLGRLSHGLLDGKSRCFFRQIKGRLRQQRSPHQGEIPPAPQSR
jgi:hypothetical protein